MQCARAILSSVACPAVQYFSNQYIVTVEKLLVLHNLSVFLALGIQHAMRTCHIVICGLPRSTVFFHVFFINGTIFEKKKLLNTKYVY